LRNEVPPLLHNGVEERQENSIWLLIASPLPMKTFQLLYVRSMFFLIPTSASSVIFELVGSLQKNWRGASVRLRRQLPTWKQRASPKRHFLPVQILQAPASDAGPNL